MEALLTVASGVLFGLAVHALLQRNIIRVVMGFILATNAVNLMIFVMGGVTRGQPPILPENPEARADAALTLSNPLPQALVLTSLVIAFALLAFTLVLVRRVSRTSGTQDLDAMRRADPPPRGPGAAA